MVDRYICNIKGYFKCVKEFLPAKIKENVLQREKVHSLSVPFFRVVSFEKCCHKAVQYVFGQFLVIFLLN